jgi:hypothetical protein
VRTVIQAMDSAFKTGVANDFSVISTWATDGRWYYLRRLLAAAGRVPRPPKRGEGAGGAALPEHDPTAHAYDPQAPATDLASKRGLGDTRDL